MLLPFRDEFVDPKGKFRFLLGFFRFWFAPGRMMRFFFFFTPRLPVLSRLPVPPGVRVQATGTNVGNGRDASRREPHGV